MAVRATVIERRVRGLAEGRTEGLFVAALAVRDAPCRWWGGRLREGVEFFRFLRAHES